MMNFGYYLGLFPLLVFYPPCLYPCNRPEPGWRAERSRRRYKKLERRRRRNRSHK